MSRRIPLDFSKPEDNLYAFPKLFSRLDGEPNFGVYQGVCFGQVPDQALTPLFGLLGFGVNQTWRRPDGRIEIRLKELAFYTDLASGEILRTWKNPYNDGEEVEVYHVANDPQNSLWGTTMPRIQVGDHAEAQSPTEPLLLPWQVDGDDVSMTLDLILKYPNVLEPQRWPRESVSDTTWASEHWTFFAKLSDLEDRDLPSAPYRMQMERVSQWLPWMLMGQSRTRSEPHPGFMFGRATARKCRRGVDDLPRILRDHAERHYPAFLSPPAAWSEPNVSSVETFARDRSPTPL